MAISGEGLFREKVEVFLKEKYEKDCQGSCKGKLKAHNWEHAVPHPSISAVIIENSSQYPLEYTSCGYLSGYPLEPVGDMFTTSYRPAEQLLCNDISHGARVIPPESSAGMLWMRHKGGNFGKWVGDIFSLGIAAAIPQAHVDAYISVKARIPGKNHIVALGFTQVLA